METLDIRLTPAHCALIVIDMQNDFCAADGFVEKTLGRSTAACRAVVEPVMELVRQARASKVPVFWPRALYDEKDLPAGILAKRRQMTDAVCCAAGSWGAEFYRVEPENAEPVIDKHSYSAMIGTELDGRLKQAGIRTLVFAGVQTNICVETSLRDAVCMGYHAVLASDCVASHMADLHAATIENVKMLFGDVTTGETIAEIWTRQVWSTANGKVEASGT